MSIFVEPADGRELDRLITVLLNLTGLGPCRRRGRRNRQLLTERLATPRAGQRREICAALAALADC